MAGMGMSILMIVLLIGMYFFMTRSQKKQQKERRNMLDSMKVGDSIVTIGGLHGVISEIDNTARTVTIDCEGIYLEFDRTAIRTVKPVASETTAVEEAPQNESASSEQSTEDKD